MLEPSHSLSSRTHEQLSGKMPRKMKIPPPPYIESEVAAIGNGAHVYVPKEWVGKKVRVTPIEEDDKKK